MINELKYSEISTFFDKSKIDINIKSTEVDIIGQEKAKEALQFALNISDKEYNIFVSGISGSGKLTFCEKYANEIAMTKSVPNDMCYVYNFENSREPILLSLKAGLGKEFKNDIEDLIYTLEIEIPKIFNSDEFLDEKDEIVKIYNKKKSVVIDEISKLAKKNDFVAKVTRNGFYFSPIIEGESLSEEEFEELDEEEKNIISKKTDLLQEKIQKHLKKIKNIKDELSEKLDDFEYTKSVFIVGTYISKIQEKYKSYNKVLEYIIKVKEDIISNIFDFIVEDTEEDESMQFLMPILSKKMKDEITFKYKVNLIVDNSELLGAPVIFCNNPTYNNLLGEFEYENEMGNIITDFTKIKAGDLHRANGGYLIVKVEDLLSNPFSWEAIRRTIKTGEICIEQFREYQYGVLSNSIRPQRPNAYIKVILIGSYYYYNVLSEYDEEFLKIFKSHIIFDYEMNNNEENISKVVNFIKNYEEKQEIKFDIYAIYEILRYSVRLSERADKITTRFNTLKEILVEAKTWAKIENKNIISEKYIKKAISKKLEFSKLYEQKLSDMILQNEIMIDTNGEKVGQINGLAVLDFDDYCFGKPTKITATTYVGKAGVVNIEKEAKLSGNIHDKGIQVLIGYLGNTYAQNFPISLSCRICFEQNYNGVDGDSASSTELYAVISSLSNIPIKQGIAVTGSLNQYGEIQPIGGVNYKVEGFFDICKKRGLTGKQGVIIPNENVRDLVLNDEVLNAIKSKEFHIYPIKNIDEGIEILIGKAGSEHEKGTVHYNVFEKLKKFNNILKNMDS